MIRLINLFFIAALLAALTGCTAAEFDEFSEGFAQGAAGIRSGTSSWRPQQPQVIYVQPQQQRTNCIAWRNGPWTNINCY